MSEKEIVAEVLRHLAQKTAGKTEYTTVEFGEIVGRSRYWVCELIKAGKLTAEFRPLLGRNGEYRIPASELTRWNQEGCVRLSRREQLVA